MARIPYSCKCDKCHCSPTPNDENDVTLNGGQYVYCEKCYQELFGLWKSWMLDMKITVTLPGDSLSLSRMQMTALKEQL